MNTTMMRTKAYAWKVSLLLVGAMLVACSEGMVGHMMSTASAGPTSSGSGTGAGGAGGSGSTSTGSGQMCACESKVAMMTVKCEPGQNGGSASLTLNGLTAQEIAARVVALDPSTSVPGSYTAQPVAASDGLATYGCNGNSTMTFAVR